MGLQDQCEELYKTSNLYEVIGVTKDASEAEVWQVIINHCQVPVVTKTKADQDRNREDYWRTMFPKITLQDMLNFEKSYKNCEDEKHDLMQVYVEHKGDMDRIMENVLCATLEDETRIRAILKSAICSKVLQAHKAFTNETKKALINNFVDDLEAKYCKKRASSSSGRKGKK
uniref:DNAJC9 HTH domain-containing protein n=1 Tax=Hucho hucho TaxID=62062 RepID=A0A4W5QHU3_9TELE